MSRFGRYGYVDPTNPEAAGVCDRGGEIRKRRDLHRQMEWRGGRLMWTGFLVCKQHMDVPNPQIGGPYVLKADPVPVNMPRPPIDRDIEISHDLGAPAKPDNNATLLWVIL